MSTEPFLRRLARRVTSPRTGRGTPQDTADELLARLARQPGDPALWLAVARDQARSGNRGWAFLAAEQAAELDPRWRQPVWLMADCLAREGMVESAVRLIEDRGWVDHSDAQSMYSVARLAGRGGDPDMALPLIEQVLEIDPDHPSALDARMRMLRQLGLTRSLRAFVNDLESRRSPNALRTLARDRIDDRDPVVALRYLDDVPDDAETLTLRARAFLTMGRYSRTIAQASAALELDPSNRTARRWLDEARAQRKLTELVPAPLSRRPLSVVPVNRRVLHIVSSSLPTVQAGYTVRSQAIGEAQLRSGLEPHFLTPPGFPGEEAGVEESVHGVVYHRLSPTEAPEASPDSQLERFVDEAAPLVERLRPGVLHAHSGFTNGAVAIGLGEAFDLPVIYEARGFLEDTWLATEPWADAEADRYVWRREAETRCMELADAVVTLGAAMRAEILGRGIAAEKVFVVPNAVDASRFRPTGRDDSLASVLGLDLSAVTIGYVSSLRPLEGTTLLIEALSALAESGNRVQLLLVGSGPERENLVDLAAAFGVGDRVILPGNVGWDEVAGHYALIDIFVVPRLRTRVAELVTPLKPLEAMAMERAIVASDLPALREMIEPGRTGLVFPPGNLESLVEVLIRLADDAGMRRRLGREARSWVLQHRTWERVGLKYERLYEQVQG